MKQLASLFLLALPAFLAGSLLCSCEADLTEGCNCPSSIIVSLDGQEPQTKTDYNYTQGKLVTSWKAGDVVAILPWFSGVTPANAGLYHAASSGENVFVMDKAPSGRASFYEVYYPGDKIKTDTQFNNFSYEGQVQSKADPTAHMSSYHTMRAMIYGSDYSHVDLSNCMQSACLRFNLTGMEFDHPGKLSVTVRRNGENASVFYTTNDLSTGYYSSGEDFHYAGNSLTSTLTLKLDGYGKETGLTAYMMMSNRDVPLQAGDTILIEIICGSKKYHSEFSIGKSMTLEGGHCHNLTCNGPWTADEGDYTDYAFDGEVVTLQDAGSKMDLILMGDGFIAEDIQDGTYDKIMRSAADEFFSTQPIKSFKSEFNVRYVKAVSPMRYDAVSHGTGAINGKAVTKFELKFRENETHISGNTSKIDNYALKVFGSNDWNKLKDVTVIVIANLKTRAGTCYNSWLLNNGCDYGQARAIAYCALGNREDEFKELVRHEATGHGFGKLADEYTSYSYYPNLGGIWDELEGDHQMGLYRNVDRYVTDNEYSAFAGKYAITTFSNVYWHDLFDTANNYEQVEGLGVFNGAFAVYNGFCRPTEDGLKSIMNTNLGIFNAISRRQILYRASVLSGKTPNNTLGQESELKKFLDWDAEVFLPSLSGTKADAPLRKNEDAAPLASPVNEFGYVENGRFIRVK